MRRIVTLGAPWAVAGLLALAASCGGDDSSSSDQGQARVETAAPASATPTVAASVTPDPDAAVTPTPSSPDMTPTPPVGATETPGPTPDATPAPPSPPPAPPVSPPPAATGIVPISPTPGAQPPLPPTPPPAPGAPPASNPAEDARRAASVRDYLTRTFGQPGFKPPWYDSVSDFTVQADTVTAQTALANDASGKQSASEICGVLSGFIYSADNRALSLNRVEVRGQGNALLSEAGPPASRC